MYVVVVGAGPVGRSLARITSEDGHDVVVVEADPEAAETASRELDVRVLNAAITEPELAGEARLDAADAAVATTDDDATNLMAIFMAREAGVERLVSVVNEPEHGVLFERLGAGVLVDPEHIVAEHLHARIARAAVAADASALPDGAHVVVLRLGEGSPLVGARPAEVCDGKRLPEPSVVVAVERGGTLHLPPAHEPLRADDRVAIVTAERVSSRRLDELEGGA